MSDLRPGNSSGDMSREESGNEDVPHPRETAELDSSPVTTGPARGVEKLILFYRRRLSPLKGGGSCRFEPTCSEYGLVAVRRFGAVRGTAMAVGRILRCAPWHPGGWEPVPTEYGGLRSWLTQLHR